MGGYYLVLIVFGIVSSVVSSTLKRKFKNILKYLYAMVSLVKKLQNKC